MHIQLLAIYGRYALIRYVMAGDGVPAYHILPVTELRLTAL